MKVRECWGVLAEQAEKALEEAQQKILALIMALGNDADGFAKRSLFPSLMDGELYELNFKNST